MNKAFDESIKKEIIVLSNIKNINNNSYSSFYDLLLKRRIQKENPNISNEIISSEIIKEKDKKSNLIRLESKEKYYRINEEKSKELESIFTQVKLKIKFNSKPEILRDGKFYTIFENNLIIYSDKLFNKLYEIELEENENIISVIQLDNKDLVFLSKEKLIIYRLNNDKYSLIQKIEENRTGYEIQMINKEGSYHAKSYKSSFIKDISGNRFICANNYGFKIYELNEKNEYSIILIETYYEGLKIIHELDINNFIFFSESYNNKFIIDKITLKEIHNNKKRKIINELKKRERDYNEDYTDIFIVENEKSIFECVKFTYKHKKYLEYDNYYEHHYFNGYSLLKNEILLVNIDSSFLIYDINSGKQLKRYEISVNEGYNFYKGKTNIIKWDNNNDNEFLLNLNGNIILFELINENNLTIIAQTYFRYINNLRKLHHFFFSYDDFDYNKRYNKNSYIYFY